MDYENLIEITSDTQLKAKFEEVPLDVFWRNLNDEYPEISKWAVRVILLFATTYLCESGIPRYTGTKTKYQSNLDAKLGMRIQFSKDNDPRNRCIIPISYFFLRKLCTAYYL